jgi:beta-lactamase class A
MDASNGFNRRRFLIGSGLCIAGGTFAWAAERSPFAAIEADFGGRLGVMARDTGNGDEMLYRVDERFAMCSTFKWVLTAMILSQVDRSEIALDRQVSYGAGDLLDYAPVTRKHASAGAMTVEALCRAAVTVSDNTAANLLLKLAGGPAGLTAFLSDCGDTVTRLDRYEPELNTNLAGDERDTTTPRAMLGTMDSILLGEVLSAASRRHLIGWLKETTTGRTRLRAGLPQGWLAGDKTGTGENGAANDVAIVWPPGREPILIASYLSGSGAPHDALNGAHARIAEAMVRRMG